MVSCLLTYLLTYTYTQWGGRLPVELSDDWFKSVVIPDALPDKK